MSRETDPVGRRIAQWRGEMPDIDTRGMAVLGRARWITLASRPSIEAIFAASGLDAGEFDVLATLRRHGAPFRMRPTELFRSLMVSSGGLTNRLLRLQRAQLIRRLHSPDDARSLLVELTGKGRDLAERVFRADMQAEAALLGSLSDAEQRTLAGLLGKLAQALELGQALL